VKREDKTRFPARPTRRGRHRRDGVNNPISLCGLDTHRIIFGFSATTKYRIIKSIRTRSVRQQCVGSMDRVRTNDAIG
jgi:hypothetical protein